MARILIGETQYEVHNAVADYLEKALIQGQQHKVQADKLKELLTGETKELLNTAYSMRQAQKEYFKYREKTKLPAAIAREEKFDALMDKLTGKAKIAPMGNLFPEEPYQDKWIKEGDTQHLDH